MNKGWHCYFIYVQTAASMSEMEDSEVELSKTEESDHFEDSN